jgi:hypothetical protein
MHFPSCSLISLSAGIGIGSVEPNEAEKWQSGRKPLYQESDILAQACMWASSLPRDFFPYHFVPWPVRTAESFLSQKVASDVEGSLCCTEIIRSPVRAQLMTIYLHLGPWATSSSLNSWMCLELHTVGSPWTLHCVRKWRLRIGRRLLTALF